MLSEEILRYTEDMGTLEERAALLTSFTYRRQYYDAGRAGTTCQLCFRSTDYVFLLKDTSGATIPIGDCCIPSLKEPNPDVYTALVASLVLLRGQVRDAKHDAKKQTNYGLAILRGEEWRTARREAKLRIVGFRHLTGEKKWLPKPLFELQEELKASPFKHVERYKHPRLLARWYEKHAARLRTLMNSGEGLQR